VKLVTASVNWAGFDLCDSQRLLCAGAIQVRDGLGGVALCQKRISQKLVGDRKVRAKLQRPLKRNDGRTVITFLRVGSLEVNEPVGQTRVDLRSLAKLHNFLFNVVLLARLQPRRTCPIASDVAACPANHANRKSWIISAPVPELPGIGRSGRR
jgi:hypothetical protein